MFARLLLTILMLIGLCQAPLAAAVGDPFAASNDQPTFLPVEQAYQPKLTVDGQQLLIDWDIAPGYYLYRAKFGFSVSDADGADIPGNAQLQPGVPRDDPYFGPSEVYYTHTRQTLGGLPLNRNLTVELRSQGCADAGLCYPPHQHFFNVDTGSGQVQRVAAATRQSGASPVAKPAAETPPPLGLMLLYAMLGGIILNLMPCVFPVLGLKVLNFSHGDSRHALSHGLSYSIGVVSSFGLVAVLLLSLKASGEAIGWGFQLQNPGFVAALALLFFVLGLSMMGQFALVGRWMGWGDELTRGGDLRSSFFTGVLATVVASPCTAPFMGTALGFALAQPAAVALAVFLALGAGMALPVLLLTLQPGWMRHLPKPGPWMERLQQLLAFPLFATSLWLAWVAGRQTGVDGMALIAAAALALVFALWCWRQQWRLMAAAALLLGGYGLWSLEPTVSAPDHAGRWTPERVERLRAEGRPVFVDVTADWCITCKVNESLVLSRSDVQQHLIDTNTAYLIADWTRYDPEITRLVEAYGRGGIPLYLYFPLNRSAPAMVLPQILTVELMLALGDER